jgi:hypothetical protein
MKQFNMRPDHPLRDGLKALETIPEPRILTIPTKLAFLVSAYCEQPGVKFCYDWMTEEPGGLVYMLAEREVYQYPKSDLAYFSKKYGINTLFIEKKYLPKATGFGIRYALDKLDLLYENEVYSIHRLTPKDGNS